MALPPAVEALWKDFQAARAEILKEAEGLSQAQADWRPSDRDWSIGEVLHHLTLAENATGKLTTKLLREAEAAGTLRPYPADLKAFAPLPRLPKPLPETPRHIWPEKSHPLGQLLTDMKSTRDWSRQSIERLGSVDPRPLTWKHEFGMVLDLGQWWRLMVNHDRMHVQQIRAVKASPGFPAR